jgi:crotonobetainyl-CoA:carnitine CoA-transferase CaiB-like acyl-CoA transferase
MKQPLEGIRVLDLSRILAGPSCTQILGDLGADVIKIERPGAGDDTRSWGPPFLTDENGEPTRESAYFLSINRNKRSVTVDITTDDGKAILYDLIEKSDVLVENFKVGDLDKRGFGWEEVHAKAPSLVYCSITGYGQDGPYAPQPGYDFIIQGMGGLMSITGEPDGEPMKVAVPIADIMSGMYATVSILAALREREKEGIGCRIDISLLDCQVAWLYNQVSNFLVDGLEPKRFGNAHPNIVPYQTFATADGHVNLGVGNDPQFFRFCSLIERPDLRLDPRFATNTLRLKHRKELITEISTAFAKRTSAHWLSLCRQEQVPCGPIHTIPEVFEDPQVKARGVLAEVKHSATGEKPVRLLRSPIRMSGVELGIRSAPPMLGEHTNEVLGNDLGYSEAKIAALHDKGVV